jgi:hypothetical protein
MPVLLFAGLFAVGGLAAQQKGPLKNSSIITMSGGGTSESVLLYMIKSNETEFDLSPKGIAELKAAKVSQKVIDAMAASAQKAPGAAAAGGTVRAGSPSPARQPYVELVSDKSRVPVPRFLARITTAKVERKDLADLATEGAVGRSLESTAEDAAGSLVSRGGSSLASSATEAAKGLVGGLFKRKPKLTYLWSIPVQMTLLNVAVDKPTFQAYYQSVPHVNGEDFTPYLVHLIRERKNDWRLVGASEGSPEALTEGDWEVFDDFSEEEVKVSVTKGEQGQMTVEPRKVLEPGEYAVVLRPTSSRKKFSGPDISDSANDGLMFNSVWGFTVKGK